MIIPVADKNAILKEKHTHTLFMVLLAILQVWFPWTAYPTKWAGAWLFHSTYFQRVLSNNIMIFASDKLQVQSHLLVPHKNNHIKIWTHDTQIPLLAIMIFINSINWVCAFQLTYFKELLWMVKPNKQFFSLQLFYFISFHFQICQVGELVTICKGPMSTRMVEHFEILICIANFSNFNI